MKVFLIILLILLLIALLPLGVSFEYSAEGIYLAVNAWLLKVQLLPKKEKREKKKKTKKKKKPKKPEKEEEEKPKRGGTIDFIKQLLPVIKDILGRFRRKLTINYLTVIVNSGSPDPYDAAMMYGRVSAAMGAALAVLENMFRIKKRDLHSTISFEGEGNSIYVDTKLSLRVWEIIYIAVGAIPAVKAYMAWTKQPDGGKAENNGQESHK